MLTQIGFPINAAEVTETLFIYKRYVSVYILNMKDLCTHILRYIHVCIYMLWKQNYNWWFRVINLTCCCSFNTGPLQPSQGFKNSKFQIGFRHTAITNGDVSRQERATLTKCFINNLCFYIFFFSRFSCSPHATVPPCCSQSGRCSARPWSKLCMREAAAHWCNCNIFFV